MACNICNCADGDIYECLVCKTKVHENCYGEINSSSDKQHTFTCTKCVLTEGKNQKPNCELCIYLNGAMKPTTDQRWVHVVCALFTDNVCFEDTNTMELIDITQVKKNDKALCYRCIERDKRALSKLGNPVPCSSKGCSKFFHVTCAQRDDMLYEIPDGKNKLIFNLFCKNHAPKKDAKRLSNEGVKVRAQANSRKAKQSKAAQKNSNWVEGNRSSSKLTVSPVGVLTDVTNSDNDKKENEHVNKNSHKASKSDNKKPNLEGTVTEHTILNESVIRENDNGKNDSTISTSTKDPFTSHEVCKHLLDNIELLKQGTAEGCTNCIAKDMKIAALEHLNFELQLLKHSQRNKRSAESQLPNITKRKIQRFETQVSHQKRVS